MAKLLTKICHFVVVLYTIYILFSRTKALVDEGTEDAKLMYPHKVLSGVNHAQFCTGETPWRVQDLWIEPEVTDDVSRALIGEAMAPFFAFYSSVSLQDIVCFVIVGYTNIMYGFYVRCIFI